MKRILTALLLAGLTAAFVLASACGDDDDGNDAEAASESADSNDQADPEAQGNATEAPPLLFLEAGEARIEGQLGNYQWVGVIADAFAVVTPTEPTKLPAGPISFTTSDTPFQHGTLAVFAVGDGQIQPETVPDGSMLRWAAFPEEIGVEPLTLEVGPDGEADLSDLEPGTYLVSFFANWEQGYGEFGFYIEIV